MSRGFPASRKFGARETAPMKLTAREMMEIPVSNEAVFSAAEALSKDRAALSALPELAKRLYRHFGPSSYWKSAQANKQNKMDMVALFEKLPAEVKKLVTLPPEAAKTLWRGVKGKIVLDGDQTINVVNVPSKDPEVPGWEEGGFAYSFTSRSEVAHNFGWGDGGVVINAGDAIESFKGIINLARLHNFLRNYEGFALQNKEWPAVNLGSAFSWNKPPDFNDIIKESGGEMEVLVYGIKFKPGAFDKQTNPYT